MMFNDARKRRRRRRAGVVGHGHLRAVVGLVAANEFQPLPRGGEGQPGLAGKFCRRQIKMEPAKIVLLLSTLPEWSRTGEIISRTYVFRIFRPR